MSERSDMAIVLDEERPLRQRIQALDRLMLDAWRRGYKAAEKDHQGFTPDELVVIAAQSGIAVEHNWPVDHAEGE